MATYVERDAIVNTIDDEVKDLMELKDRFRETFYEAIFSKEKTWLRRSYKKRAFKLGEFIRSMDALELMAHGLRAEIMGYCGLVF